MRSRCASKPEPIRLGKVVALGVDANHVEAGPELAHSHKAVGPSHNVLLDLSIWAPVR